MSFETDQKILEIKDEVLNNRVARLVKELGTEPIARVNFENLYVGDSLRAIAPYGGLASIVEAYGRLRRYIAEFENLAEEGVENLTPETVQRAEDSLKVFRDANNGENLSEFDRKAANIIAADLLRRAKKKKAKELLDADTLGAINAIYSEIRQLLDAGKIAEVEPQFFEDRFPLAWTVQRVEEIERLMERATQRHLNDIKHQSDRLVQRQVRVKKK